MGPSSSDEKILSYNDVVLRRSDLDILRGPYYLNDRIIEFYFSYLSSTYPSQDILLVPPSISFWITNCPDLSGLKDFIEPLQLNSKKLIVFTVNDNSDVTQDEGGTHWSLLAFDRDRNVFVHHDSMKGLNGWYAKKLYKTVEKFVGVHGYPSTACFVECLTPQQTNGYDCGVYVLAITKVICHWYVSGANDKGDQWLSAMDEQVDASTVTQLRDEILRLILHLMNKE
ncbi:NEDD8-specific protease 1 [Magnolia sinica]|uniref:NEDD8-specific protease 1 n=1 Tax=Magnolia sinica TaxID=86752 RepID=UPI002658E63A|nr:NEDD8-specific protease 1 [Magnolia sinica]XP_058081459.1 NEDD8-specific protease 1 [Magnolia sinica]